jgi:hypothetical protein
MPRRTVCAPRVCSADLTHTNSNCILYELTLLLRIHDQIYEQIRGLYF